MSSRYLLVGLALLSLYGCPVNWNETYRPDEKQPLDTYVLYELLEARPEGVTLIQDSSLVFTEDSLERSNYLFVGFQPYYREAAVTQLLDYVERGNTAFIAASFLPEDLAYHLFGDQCYYDQFADLPNQYDDPRYPISYRDTIVAYLYPRPDSFELRNERYWQPYTVPHYTLDDRLFCDELLDNDILGVIDTVGVNFVRFGWGEGNFYFHTNPFYFTNYFLVDTLQAGYAEQVLSVMGEGPVFYDDYHRNYRPSPSSRRSSQNVRRSYNGGRNLLEGNQALSYIQERRELALAWYTLVAGVVLFVLFRGKRRQRVIPVIRRRENSSRRFIDTISRLVYQKGNHAALAQRELTSLRYHLKHRFGLRWREGEDPPEDLARQTGLGAEVIELALRYIRLATRSKTLTEEELLRFYRAIEPLYRA